MVVPARAGDQSGGKMDDLLHPTRVAVGGASPRGQTIVYVGEDVCGD